MLSEPLPRSPAVEADVVSVVVEIPKGSRDKYELDPTTWVIMLEVIAAARSSANS